MSSANAKNVKKLLETIKETSPPKFQTVGTWAMIGGVPNVGKSSIINALRKQTKDFPNSN